MWSWYLLIPASLLPTHRCSTLISYVYEPLPRHFSTPYSSLSKPVHQVYNTSLFCIVAVLNLYFYFFHCKNMHSNVYYFKTNVIQYVYEHILADKTWSNYYYTCLTVFILKLKLKLSHTLNYNRFRIIVKPKAACCKQAVRSPKSASQRR